MSNPLIPASDISSTVLAGGYCIGCGACAAFDPNIEMKFNRFGQYEATVKAGSVPDAVATRVCPFADGNPNEDEIGRSHYSETGMPDSHLGYHLACYAGWVVESDFRAKGSSGGLASWLLNELLERDLVDHVVHVTSVPDNNGQPLFTFTISSTQDEVRASAKSRYYPVEMSGVIQQILEYPGRYAITGIPCFIKALRLASRESSILKERIAFTVGIVCGHLKSTAFAELFAWQCGIEPKDLRGIDFRTKLPGRSASSYGVTVEGLREGDTVSITRPTSDLVGSNWGHGFFKYKACDFCDDVVGETADISIGDAWLPEYEGDSKGTNVVVVRSPEIHSILLDAIENGRLHLDSIPASKAVQSQAGGFRHRRDGLAFRLLNEDAASKWRPVKRVQPSKKHLSSKLQKMHSLRHRVAMASHAAFSKAKREGNLPIFIHTMAPLTNAYDKYYRRPLILRAVAKFVRLVKTTLTPK